MKKILFLLILPIASFAQLTNTDLNTEADSLLTNSAKNNNAKYFNRLFKNMIKNVVNGSMITTTGSSGAATFNYSTGVLNIPTYAASTLPSNAVGALNNDGAGSLSWVNNVISMNTSWTTITLTNGWALNGGSTLQWRYNATGRVELRGRLSSGTATGAIVASAGSVPNAQDASGVIAYRIPIVDFSNNVISFIVIGSNGQLSIPTYVTLTTYEINGVSYLASY